MSVEVSYKKQSLLGVIFILIILVVVEVGIKSYELVYPPCEFMTADVVVVEVVVLTSGVDTDSSFLSLQLKRKTNMTSWKTTFFILMSISCLI